MHGSLWVIERMAMHQVCGTDFLCDEAEQTVAHPAARLPRLQVNALLERLRTVEIGRLLGVSTVSVHQWATGKKPFPLIRRLALNYLVGRLVGIIGGKYPPQTRFARRAEIARAAAEAYLLLDRDEFEEDTRRIYQAEDIERAAALGERLLVQLEARQ